MTLSEKLRAALLLGIFASIYLGAMEPAALTPPPEPCKPCRDTITFRYNDPNGPGYLQIVDQALLEAIQMTANVHCCNHFEVRFLMSAFPDQGIRLSRKCDDATDREVIFTIWGGLGWFSFPYFEQDCDSSCKYEMEVVTPLLGGGEQVDPLWQFTVDCTDRPCEED